MPNLILKATRLLSVLLLWALLPAHSIAQTGIITTIAGNGTLGDTGDGGPATAAEISGSYSIANDGAGNLYLSGAEYINNCVRVINTSGIISNFAGNYYTPGFSGDGGAATAAELAAPDGVCVDRAGNVYISDAGNNRIRKVNTSGIITTIAGNGTEGHSGDGGPATDAEMYVSFAMAVDKYGNIYI